VNQPGLYAPAIPMPTPAVVSDAHEFSPEQDEVIVDVTAATRAWGIVSLIVGVLNLAIGGLLSRSGAAAWTYLATGVVSLVVAGVFVDASSSLRRITTTRGHDMPHLLTALGKLGTAFKIQAVVTLLALVAGFVLGAMQAM